MDVRHVTFAEADEEHSASSCDCYDAMSDEITQSCLRCGCGSEWVVFNGYCQSCLDIIEAEESSLATDYYLSRRYGDEDVFSEEETTNHPSEQPPKN